MQTKRETNEMSKYLFWFWDVKSEESLLLHFMGLYVSMVPLFTTKYQDAGSSLEFKSEFKTQVGVWS